jgi:hypothetical protein
MTKKNKGTFQYWKKEGEDWVRDNSERERKYDDGNGTCQEFKGYPRIIINGKEQDNE